VVAKRSFYAIHNYLFRKLWKWIRRRHGNKNIRWLIRKYWQNGSKPGIFSAVINKKGKKQVYELFHPRRVAIVRHTKIRGKANPHDPSWKPYFQNRKNLLVRQRMRVV
jgi:RNA-directed DNA polymerase